MSGSTPQLYQDPKCTTCFPSQMPATGQRFGHQCKACLVIRAHEIQKLIDKKNAEITQQRKEKQKQAKEQKEKPSKMERKEQNTELASGTATVKITKADEAQKPRKKKRKRDDEASAAPTEMTQGRKKKRVHQILSHAKDNIGSSSKETHGVHVKVCNYGGTLL
jgi:hypothetical protein